MTPGSGVRMLGCGQILHNSEYTISVTLSMYITLIAIVLNDNNAAFQRYY